MEQREAMAMWPYYEFSVSDGKFLLTLDSEVGGYLIFKGDTKADCWGRALEWLSQRPRHNTSAI